MQDKTDFRTDLLRRISATKTTRWIRFALVAAMFLAWVAWMGQWWLAIFLILLFDIYITGYIPLTWWKKSPNKTLRAVMSWVDAIVYALVLVYFVFAFVGQNYQIPSSSLEKTLLTGDYLWVNKMTYGPRVPMTPVHFPLVHNRMPLLGCDSYLDRPAVSYRRLRGLRDVEQGDIVVFNFPAGDTVTTLTVDTPFYYDALVLEVGRSYMAQNGIIPEAGEADSTADAIGRRIVHSDKERFGTVKYRPVDRRQNFVKRVVGLPGQRLKIVSDTIFIDGRKQPVPAEAQFNYVIATRRALADDDLHRLGIARADLQSVDAAGGSYITRTSAPGLHYYYIPATTAILDALRADGTMTAAVRYNAMTDIDLFPAGVADSWTLSDYGGNNGLLIPARGLTVPLTPENWKIYRRVIRNYENHPDARWVDGKGVVIDGKPAPDYTFGMDYYFMMGDNRYNSQDSRFWGFVPEDHIVGTPMRVLISFDNDRGLFDGKIRWNRILRDANPDK